MDIKKPAEGDSCGFKLVYKPSSVLDGHLSRRGISDALKRCKQQVEQTICRYLASSGVYIAPIVTNRSVSSYLALSTLPKIILAVYFCCTFLEVTFTGS